MKLAFCGLGIMGEAMVRRLLQAGHEVQVWNRTRAKADGVVALGARWCDTPAQAAQGLWVGTQALGILFGPPGGHAQQLGHLRQAQAIGQHSL